MKKWLCVLMLGFTSSVWANSTPTEQLLTGNSKIAADFLDTFFNQKDVQKLQTFFTNGEMLQHNPGGKDGMDAVLQFAQSSIAKPIRYERGLVMEKGDLVMLHGRYSGWLGKDMIAVDIFRIENGKVVEHWDVMQEEVSAEKTASGRAMFPIK
ncbi:nuclear transport factor 2 family protein [Ursidibacter sp. B-7004-1]